MFDEKSRYAQLPTYTVTDHRGGTVTVVTPAPALPKSLQGIHLLRQGERLDLLAAKYLDNPAGFWRISEENDVMLPEALSEAREIQIPTKNG
jgi:hypothetical protein